MIRSVERVNAFIELGNQIKLQLSRLGDQDGLFAVMAKAESLNRWFTQNNQKKALAAIAHLLEREALEHWLEDYNIENDKASVKKVGVIMAGNIPAVGFHDLLCVLISGHHFAGKCSSDDAVLITWIAEQLIKIEPGFDSMISFTDKLKLVDALIATGSNNSARHFNYYFKNTPRIIRKNRNSIAVLTGNETKEELEQLGEDIFSYFGLGCRNVSKLMVPQGYTFNTFFESIAGYGDELNNHNKYLNNYDYYRAIYLLEQIPFLTNNFLHVKEDTSIASPVSVLHFETYTSEQQLHHYLASQLEHLQCIVSQRQILGGEVKFGLSQSPLVKDYADGVDTMEFLLGLD